MTRVLRAVLIAAASEPQDGVLVGLLADDLEYGVSSLWDYEFGLHLDRLRLLAKEPP